MKIMTPTYSFKSLPTPSILNSLSSILNRNNSISRNTSLMTCYNGWKKYITCLCIAWSLIHIGCPAYAAEGGDKVGKTSASQQISQNSSVNNVHSVALDIPQDYLIPFMKEALQLSTSRSSSPASVKIKEDLVEGPDNRDYVRLLNIRLLFARQKQNTEILKKWHWLLNLSRQIDALNIHDGSLRELITPTDNDGMFWRRLAYLHHGFSLPELAASVRDYLINQIWLSGDLLKVNTLVEKFFLKNIFQHRSESSRIKSEWLNRMSFVLAWPSLVPIFWRCLSHIPLEERVKNFHYFLRKYNLRNSSDDLSDQSKDEVETILIHPYLKAGAHPNQQFKIFSESIQTIMRRARELNKESFDRKAYDKLQSEIDEITKKINTLQTEIRKLKNQQAPQQPAEAKVLSEKVEALQKLKEEKSKKEEEKDVNGHIIDTSISELVEIFEAFGSVQLEGLSKHFEEYHRSISSLSFDNILFYIGLVGEYEHLKIANENLERILAAKRLEPDAIFQGLSVVAEALNNVFTPAVSDDEDLTPFKEVFRFFRNKVVEHETFLTKAKMVEFLAFPQFPSVLEGIRKDLRNVQTRISARFKRLDSIVKAGHEWEPSIIKLKDIYFQKLQKPAKDNQTK